MRRIAGTEAVSDHLEATVAGRALLARFVPGPDVADAMRAAADVRLTNRWASLMRLAAPPSTAADIDATISAYAAALRALAAAGLAAHRRADVTVRPLDLGVALPAGVDAAHKAAQALAAAARAAGTGLTLASPRRADTGASRAVASAVVRDFPETRIGIRTDLARAESDCAALFSDGVSIVLVAGDADTHRRFIRCLRLLADADAAAVFAVHDPQLVAMVTSIVRRTGVDPARFEFAMPYGARPDLQRRIADRGHQVRVVVPWGVAWRDLVAARLSERHRGAWFLARSLTDRGLAPIP